MTVQILNAQALASCLLLEYEYFFISFIFFPLQLERQHRPSSVTPSGYQIAPQPNRLILTGCRHPQGDNSNMSSLRISKIRGKKSSSTEQEASTAERSTSRGSFARLLARDPGQSLPRALTNRLSMKSMKSLFSRPGESGGSTIDPNMAFPSDAIAEPSGSSARWSAGPLISGELSTRRRLQKESCSRHYQKGPT